ncbi:MAG: 3-octaprenyl-4-hydroxybenzoate carboxy-lyase [Candidatus Heimdallarchaeota archaeon LC_2]|nr:MAG: 3-octaprenyl-4-hydroxybenzoate carboxy-lyase [Candidatus Heimdallarchaeota archaeon LC_2]
MFRKYLEEMRVKGKVVTITDNINPKYELGRILEKFDNDKIVELTSVTDSDYPILGNVVSSREALAISLGIKKDKLHQFLLDALQSPSEPKIIDNAPFLKNVDENPDLNKHGIPKFFKEDAGNYYTSGLVITKGLDSKIHNSSIHRQLLLSNNTTTARIVPRHLFHNIKVAESMDQDLPIAVAFGMHPAVILAASTPTAISLDEMHVANSMLSGKLERVKLPNSGILVPTHAEVVYEGVVLKNQKVKEGPFVDVTGTLDKIRDEPVFRIDRVYYRDNAYMTTILPSKTEHYILMGLGREAKIKESVRNIVPEVGEVYLSTGGGGWLHAIVAIEKQSEGDAKNAIFAAFAAHGSLKWVTVVNTDIDVYDPENVEWAVITRTGEDDIIVIDKARGSSLDPAMDEKSKTSIKVGIDATMSLYKSIDSYRKIKIPKEDEV